VNTSRAQLIFFLPNPIFAICLNFQQQNPLKNQYFPHPYLSRAFQRYQECGMKHPGLGDLGLRNKTKQNKTKQINLPWFSPAHQPVQWPECVIVALDGHVMG
jgi:hypothetical protein